MLRFDFRLGPNRFDLSHRFMSFRLSISSPLDVNRNWHSRVTRALVAARPTNGGLINSERRKHRGTTASRCSFPHCEARLKALNYAYWGKFRRRTRAGRQESERRGSNGGWYAHDISGSRSSMARPKCRNASSCSPSAPRTQAMDVLSTYSPLATLRAVSPLSSFRLSFLFLSFS